MHEEREKQGLGQNSSAKDEDVEREEYGREEREFLSREIGEKSKKSRYTLYRKIGSSMDREVSRGVEL